MALPAWMPRLLRLLAVALVALFGIAAVFAAVVMPYRLWDSLAFGSWSRSIAETGDLWAGQPALMLQRPLFYVGQGLAWRVLDDAWVGRLLSLSFAALLVAAVWLLAGRLTPDRDGRSLLAPLAVGLVLASSLVATYAASGMTDVPVAATVALTALVAWGEPLDRRRVVLLALCAAAAVLAKPTALLAFAGLVPALFVLRSRPTAVRGAAGIGAGIALALLYAAWQAARIDLGLTDFLTAGNDEFWRERGAAARWDSIARAEWLGAGLRLLVVFGLVHAIVRAAGARPRVALGAGAVLAFVWSIAGPIVADGSAGYPFDGSVAGLLVWLALAGAIVTAPFLANRDPMPPRVYAALLVWLAPPALVWAFQRADETRHLAPAWAPLVLVAAAGLASVSLALARLRPALAGAPALAVAMLALANLPAVDGLGRDGWRGLLDLGPSGWSDRAAMENYAYGPFSYELDLARENAGEAGRIVSSNGRLAYFFPGRVEVRYARGCSELAGARFFSFLTSGESLELAQREGQPLDPLGWLQCTEPEVVLVGEQEGIYAAFAVGQPARQPLPEDCRIAPGPGNLLDAVFGAELTYAEAKTLLGRALSVGFEGTRIERTGCSIFRVVVTGVPEDEVVQAEFRAQVERVGLSVRYARAERYPEVPPDVPAVE